ncbi:MAG: sulfatase [Pirellula sp.]|nr:sulfatase [Pirellula sp.]
MHPLDELRQLETRRQFFARGKSAVGFAALSSLLGQSVGQALGATSSSPAGVKLPGTHFPPKAKNVIYLHMVGGPSQMDLYDYKPEMQKWYDKDLPESIRKGQRLTTMTSGQARFPIAPSKYKFKQHGKSGMWVSEMLPETAKCVDDMCFIRSLNTEAINHEPAITAMQTGSQVSGRPCFGSWASYGLGSLNENLPTFVVLVAVPTNRAQEQAISAKLWSSGFLPGHLTGVSFRSKGDPILYINNPPGVPDSVRRRVLDNIRTLNEQTLKQVGDPETQTRIQQYEMAFRMQASVPELTNLADETEGTFTLYGEDAKKPGSLPNSMLMARRLVERGVRFVQIYHNNWDHHSDVAGRMPNQCKDLDRATYGLINDLKQRGMLDETLIIWGGEFGRTIYSQGGLTKENYGRDHHPRCFTMWMAGGGVKGGVVYGETDEFSYNIVKDPVHIRDFHATTLQLLGFDHNRFTYKHQGLDFKLTGVEPARVVKELLA